MRDRFCLYPGPQIGGAIAGAYIGAIASMAYFRTITVGNPWDVTSASVILICTILNGALIGSYSGAGLAAARELKQIENEESRLSLRPTP